MKAGRTLNQYATIIAITTLITCLCNNSIAYSVDAHQLIKSSIEHFRNVSDYTCKLDKRVNKDGIIREELAIYVKYKKPKHYYFLWNEGETKGQEVIYVAGRYDDKIVAHTGGLFRYFTLRLDPEGRLAMKKNRHSLKDSGMEKIMHSIEKDYILSQELGMDPLKYIGEERIGEADTWIIRGSFPENKGFYAHEIIIFIDKQLHLPIKISVFDWSNILIEEYIFRDLRINVGFKEFDFNPDNPEYNFH